MQTVVVFDNRGSEISESVQKNMPEGCRFWRVCVDLLAPLLVTFLALQFSWFPWAPCFMIFLIIDWFVFEEKTEPTKIKIANENWTALAKTRRANGCACHGCLCQRERPFHSGFGQKIQNPGAAVTRLACSLTQWAGHLLVNLGF